MQTAMAHLRGICRWDKMQHNARPLRLVRHKLAELGEGPIVTAAPFGFATGGGVGTLSYPSEVFESQCRLPGLGGVHKGLGNAVVGVALEPLFTPRQPCHKLTATTPRTSGALRGFALECCSQASKVVTT